MIKAIYGKDKILMFRLLENAKQKKATKLALQTEHTLSYENNVDFICTDQSLRYYINIYNLGDKISQRKRRTKAEIQSQENKNTLLFYTRF